MTKDETSDPQWITEGQRGAVKGVARLGPEATNSAQMGSPSSYLPIPCYPAGSINRLDRKKSADLMQTCAQTVSARRCLTHVHVWMTMVMVVPVELSRAQNRTCSLSNPTCWNPTCTVVPLAVITVAFQPDTGLADVTLSVVVLC